MYTLVLILLGIWALLIIGGFYRKHRKEKRRVETWLASQPLDILISGRRRVAERACALLKEQIDCNDFIDEFGKSEDPEIKKLVNIVERIETEEFLKEYRKPIEKRISALEKTIEEQEKLDKWLNQLLNYGFRDIAFPIAIISNGWKGLTIISDLEEYAFDPDLYFGPLKIDATLIDSKGMQYSLRYHEELEFSYPKKKIAELDLNKVKQLVRQRLRKKKFIPIIESSNTIKELYGRLYKKYHG